MIFNEFSSNFNFFFTRRVEIQKFCFRYLSGGGVENIKTKEADYFPSYGDISVHMTMLRDRPRVNAYLGAIMQAKSQIEGKIVVDVGAGTGILSMLCALHGGAKHVYAIEACDKMVLVARTLIKTNKLEDRVTVIHGTAEEAQIPNLNEKADVLISEWMGFYLVHEGMLGSVLDARDRLLKPGGLMMPARARMHARLISLDDESPETFSNFYGLDFTTMIDLEQAQNNVEAEPDIANCIQQEQLLCEPALINEMDLTTLTKDALKAFVCEANFVVGKAGQCAALALWFDTDFIAPGAEGIVRLDTSPLAEPTHWKQTVIKLGVFVPVEVGTNVPVRMTFQQSAENPRIYEISVEII